MSRPHQPGPVTLATVLEALNATVDELKATKDEVAKLKTFGRRNRLFIAVDVALTVLLSVFGALTVHATQSADQATRFADQIHANNVAGCEANNVRLTKQEKALDAILSQVPPQNAVERAIVAKDLGFIMAGWAPRNCQAAYPPPPGH